MSVNQHIIDPEGDVFLHLLSDSLDLTMVLRVSSKVLCLASPVFKAMLGPDSKFQEAEALRHSTETPTMTPLRGDDPNSLLMLLQAAHLPGHLLPRRLHIDELYKLAIVCDKYDMAKVLVPWSIVLMDADQDEEDPRWLAVAWVFRDTWKFNSVTSILMYDATLDEKNYLVFDQQRVDFPLVPDTVIDAIRAGRLRVLTTFHTQCQVALGKYTNAAASGVTLCQVPTSGDAALDKAVRTSCDRIAAGTLLMSLAKVGFLPTQAGWDAHSAREIPRILTHEIKSGSHELMAKSDMGHRRCDRTTEWITEFYHIVGLWEGLALSDFMPKELIFFPEEL